MLLNKNSYKLRINKKYLLCNKSYLLIELYFLLFINRKADNFEFSG